MIQESPKTTEQRISLLQGQIIALSVYVRAIADQLPSAQVTSANDAAQNTLRLMADQLLALPFQDDVFDGIDWMKSLFFQNADDKTQPPPSNQSP